MRVFVFVRNNSYIVVYRSNIDVQYTMLMYFKTLNIELIQTIHKGSQYEDVFAHDVGPFIYSYCAL